MRRAHTLSGSAPSKIGLMKSIVLNPHRVPLRPEASMVLRCGNEKEQEISKSDE
jgi:hypothetical protein